MLRHSQSLQSVRYALALTAALLAGFGLRANAQEAKIQLKGSVSPLVRQARPLAPLNPAESLRFSFALPLRDQPGLDALLKRIYTPGDPLFHHFLTSQEFTARFGPTQADYDALIAYAKQQGFTIAAIYSNRALLDATAPAQSVEKAFSVRLLNYQAADKRVFRAPDAEPTLPASIAQRISGVIGLDTANPPRPLVKTGRPPVPANGKARPNALPAGLGSGPGSGYSPSDIKTAYNFSGVTETGSGQTLGLVEFDGYKANDITGYEDQFGLPHVPLQNVLLDGVTGIPTAPDPYNNPTPTSPLEVTLDIELMAALAPGASKIIVYEGTGFLTVFSRIASDNLAKQISVSWSSYGADSDQATSFLNSENSALSQMATQGQSVYIASGDSGDHVLLRGGGTKFGVFDPASQPYAVAVGGTTLVTNGAGGAYTSEAAWYGSGGGVSGYWPLPAYQPAIVSAGSNGSATMRNLPDVALNADTATGYSIYYTNAASGGGWYGGIGGTSCAAPLWAAFNALVNQRRAAHGLGNLGFPNPTIYAIAQSAAYSSDFYDITSGSNGMFPAVSGYDNVTGWGSFNGAGLLYDMQLNGYAFYVDAANINGLQYGTALFPYATVAQAVNAAPAVGITVIYIRGGAYPENSTISKPVLFINNGGGNALIGN